MQVEKADGPVEGPALERALAAGALVAKVTDFGLTRALDANVTHASGMRQGTPFYIAPEVRYVCLRFLLGVS